MPPAPRRPSRPNDFGRRAPRVHVPRRRYRRRRSALLARLGRLGQAALGLVVLIVVLGLMMRLLGILPGGGKTSGAAVDAPAVVAVTPPPVHEKRRSVAVAGPEKRARPAKPAWQRYAVAAPETHGRARVVIVIDDLGLDRAAVRRLAAIPGPLTLAFLPYAPRVADQAAMMRAAGHELLVHLPMEPKGGSSNPGPMVLAASESRAEFDRRLEWNLSRFEGYVGINNHMGSRLTEDPRAMRRVMRALRARGLLFLDSRTTAGTVAEREAVALGLPHAARDVFLDNEQDARAVLAQLAKLERLARQRGQAIAIGHPHRETLDAIGNWIPAATRRGLVLVPLSAAVEMPEPSRLSATAAAGRH